MQPRPEPIIGRPQPILGAVLLLVEPAVLLECVSQLPGKPPGGLRHISSHLVPPAR